MSGKQNSNTTKANNSDETFMNPLFPNKILKNVNGRTVIVGYKTSKQKQKIANKKSN